ncbi:MAG: hypothetical protein ABEH65_13080 [Halobacteriales archaeon]
MLSDSRGAWLRSSGRGLLVGSGCGLTTGGLLAYDALFQYGTVPFEHAIFVVPFVGILLAWWTMDFRTRLVAFGLQAGVAGIVVAIAFVIPLFVIKTPTTVERTLLLSNAIARAIVLAMLGTLLTVLGAVITIGVGRELFSFTRLSTGPWVKVGLTVVLLVGSIGLVGTAAHNYGSAVEQRGVTPELAGQIEMRPTGVELTLSIPNRLTEPLSIESVLLAVDRPDGERLTVRAFPDRSIPARSRGTVTIVLGTDRFPDRDPLTDSTVTVSGFIYTTSFNGYRARLDLPTTTRRLDAVRSDRNA